MNQNARTIVGLDIGTTKIGVVIAEVQDSGEFRIVGIGTSPSEGLRKGVVVNIEATVKSIVKAVEEAELMAGVDVKDVYVGIAGRHIRSLGGRGIVAVSRGGNEITHADVHRVIEQASTISMPSDREIIHVIPQDFCVDDQAGVKDPVGMSGVKLEGQVHIVTASTSAVQNIYKSVQRAGINVADIVLEPMASAYSVLEKDERELGVAVVDMGGGTTDVAVFVDDAIRHTSSIDLGGTNVTSDVAVGIRTPLERAEEIKRKYGTCRISSLITDEFIAVPGVGGRAERQVGREFLAKIIRARMGEIFQMVSRDIQKTRLKEQLGAGVVLTGGGALIEGAAELAEEIFGMPVKIGVPRQMGGLADAVSSPVHSTATGLVLYGLRKMEQEQLEGGPARQGNGSGWVKRVAGWLRNYF